MEIISINEYVNQQKMQPKMETISLSELSNYVESKDGNIILVYDEILKTNVWNVLKYYFDYRNTINATDLDDNENGEHYIETVFNDMESKLMPSDRQICIKQINHLEKNEQGFIQLKMMEDGYNVLGTIMDFHYTNDNDIFKPFHKTFLDEFNVVKVVM